MNDSAHLPRLASCLLVLAAMLSSCSSNTDPEPDKTPVSRAEDSCDVSTKQPSRFYAKNVTYTDRDPIPASNGKPGTSFSRPRLERATKQLEGTKNARSFLVAQNGGLVWERYFNDTRPSDANNVGSVSKALLSLVLGRAVADGRIDLDDDIREHLPERLVPDDAPRLTVRDLATMSGGLAWDEEDAAQRLDQARSYVRQILELEQVSKPGTMFEYSTGLTQLLSAVLAEATGVSVCKYAHTEVFSPIGVDIDHWPTDPDGYHAGGHSMFLTPRELERIGQLVLDETDNRIDGGPPGSWMRRALTLKWSVGCRPPAEHVGYGHLWWRSSVNDVKIWKAADFGGQSLFVIPATQTVVVITTDSVEEDAENVDHMEVVTHAVLHLPPGGECAESKLGHITRSPTTPSSSSGLMDHGMS